MSDNLTIAKDLEGLLNHPDIMGNVKARDTLQCAALQLRADHDLKVEVRGLIRPVQYNADTIMDLVKRAPGG